MKKLGLIGGVGPASTIEYYKLLIARFQQQLDTNDYPEILIHSINMTQMLAYIGDNQIDQVVAFLAERITVLEKAGVEVVAIASNTPHLVFDQLSKSVDIPLVSIVEATCKAVKEKNLKKLGLFGTQFTMTSGFYQKVASQYDLDIFIPETEQIEFIHDKYMNELVLNQILPETKSRLIQIAEQLQLEAGIEGLILGGTELPLILQQADFENITIFDTTQIHVDRILENVI